MNDSNLLGLAVSFSDCGNEKVMVPTLELTRQRLTTAPPGRKQAELAGRYARVQASLAANHRGVTLLASMEEKSLQATTSLIFITAVSHLDASLIDSGCTLLITTSGFVECGSTVELREGRSRLLEAILHRLDLSTQR